MIDIRPRQLRAPSIPLPSRSDHGASRKTGSSQLTTILDGYDHATALFASLRRTQQGISSAYTQVQKGHAREMDDASLEAARKVKKPSKLRYSLFIWLCIIADTAGAALITGAFAAAPETFGVGAVLGILVTILVTIIMWIGSRIFLGKRAKEVKEHIDQLQEKSKDLARDIQVAQQQYNNLLTWMGTAKKEFPQLASQGSALIVKAGALAQKTNMIKYSGKAMIWVSNVIKNPIFVRISELIPFWNILPWWTIGAVATYISHKADWREAQDILNGYTSGKQEVMNTTSALYKTRLALTQAIFKKNINTLTANQLHEAATT